MATTERKDFDAELVAWLEQVHDEQATEVLDQMADLWLANADAKAVKDKRPPIGDPTHERINEILDRIVGL